MGLVDLFRPKWKHSDAAIRASAVRQLGSEEQAALAAIAREDEDPAIRRLALKKVEDPALLLELAGRDVDEGLRDLARDRAVTLLVSVAVGGDAAASSAAIARIADQSALATIVRTAALEQARRAALERLTDDRALAEVARGTEVALLRAEALRRIADPTLLRSLALSGEQRDLGLAALERIDDAEALQAIAKKARHKAVRRHAREKLASRSVAEEPSAAGVSVNKRLSALCRGIEALSKSRIADWAVAAKQIKDAEAALEDLRAEGAERLDEELVAALRATCGALAARRFDELQAAAARAERSAALQQALERRAALCERAERLGDEARTEEALRALQNEWDVIGALEDRTAKELERRFARALDAPRAPREQPAPEPAPEPAPQAPVADPREALLAICAEAEDLACARKIERSRAAWEELEQRWSHAVAALAGEQQPEDESVAKRFAQARARIAEREAEEVARREQRAQQNAERLEALRAQVAEAAETTDLRLVERLIQDIVNALKRSGPLPSQEREAALREALQEGRQQLQWRLDELREADEWKRWSNVPTLEALCGQAEALLAVTDKSEAAAQLKALQKSWKDLGPVPRDKGQELWERFKTACDKAREHCADYFASLDQERKDNLAKKQALCEQVEQLAESTDWEVTAEKIKQLQGQWRDIGPVSREESEAVWKRFRAACDTFFERRKKLHLKELERQRKDCLHQKQALCEQVEQLAASTDWEATAEQIKQLQGEWRKIGPVPRKQSDAVWKRFRAACDAFFNAREAFFDEQRQEQRTAKEALCAEVEALVAEPGTLEELGARVAACREQFGAIGAAPRADEEALQRRFREACRGVALAHPAAFKGTDLDPEATQRRLENLCEQAERIAEQQAQHLAEQQAAGSVEEMANRLREALVSNTFRAPDAKDEAAEAGRRVAQLQDQWKRVGGPVAAEILEPLRARFELACGSVIARAKAAR